MKFSKHAKMPVNGVPWSLLNRVPQVPKFASALSPRVP